MAGGYPEWLPIGEDMYVNQRWVQAGIPIHRATDAIVYWRPRRGVSATWRQYERYAEGDAVAGMFPERHLLRYATYAALAAGLASRRPGALTVLAVAGAAYAWKPVRRTVRRTPPGAARGAAMIGVPLTLGFIDAAKMWGYGKGLAARLRRGLVG
jgi:hypothetical protein